MRIEDFLNSMENNQEKWDEIIKPAQSYLIVGDVGTGKSALAFHLLEKYSKKHDLLPAVVGFPREKQSLLPQDFIICDSIDEATQLENAIVLIDEAGIQLPLDDRKSKQFMVNLLSLPRHREQILILTYHFPRLVLRTYLPYFSAFLFKRPPYLLQFAGKDRKDIFTNMMGKAEGEFAKLPSDDILKSTYVIAPRIRWQGMLTNPTPSFWSDEVSKAWSGTSVPEAQGREQRGQKQQKSTGGGNLALWTCPVCQAGFGNGRELQRHRLRFRH